MNNQPCNDIQWHLINHIDELSAIEEQWHFITQKSLNPTLFSSPKWILNWYKNYWQESWKLTTIAGYINNELVVLAPLYTQRSQHWPYLNVMYPLGQGEPEAEEVSSEYCDIIISSSYENTVLPELLKKLTALNVDQVIWHAALQGSYIKKLLETGFKYTAKTTHYRYLLECKAWALATLSKNTRSRYKRSSNQLANINAKFIWVNPSNYEKYASLLTDYHQERWESKGSLGAFSHPNFRSFHEFYRNKNTVKMSAIIVDNHPIAINYYLEDETSLYFYQCGWDSKAYANFSLGLTLHLWSIENCQNKYYDFMMGDIKDSYKLKFGTKQEPMTNIIINIKPYKVFINKLVNKIRSFF
jgi:hypothetical protein